MAPEKNGLRHTDALHVELSHEPIDPDQRVEGDAFVTTGYVELGALNDCSVGIWEMSAGTMTDIEEEEYFVVLSGRGIVHVLAENGFAEQTQQLTVGSVVRLMVGMHTVWQVDEPLRKIYLTPSDA